MKKTNQSGSIGVLIALGVFIVLFVSAAAFGVWAYTSRQDYKDNSDQKAAAAVAIAVKQEAIKKDAEFVEIEKKPFRTYEGSETYGRLSIQYPKTWSAAVDEGSGGSTVLNGYLHPNFVPGLQSNTNFALRFQILQARYDQVLKQLESQVKSGLSRVSPFVAAKVPSVTGSRVEGQLTTQKKGIMVLIPLRDKTVKIWTESDQFFGDFNNIILANLTFTP